MTDLSALCRNASGRGDHRDRRLYGVHRVVQSCHAGLYLTLKVRDRKGLMVELAKAVLGLGGDIVGISSSCDETAGDYRLVIKGQDIDKDRMVELVASLGHQAIEIYKVWAEGSNREGEKTWQPEFLFRWMVHRWLNRRSPVP